MDFAGNLRLFACSLLLCGHFCYSQNFTDYTFIQNLSHSYVGIYGAGISTFDINHDGWEDLTLPMNGEPIEIYLNNEGSLELISHNLPATGESKMPIWVDYDNDGDSDLGLTTLNGFFKLFENDGNFQFTDVTLEANLPQIEKHSYGHSWGDINNDGWLDLYLCNYDGDTYTNDIFLSDGNGGFIDITATCGADDGLKYSFLAVFIDYDRDGWQDIFVINDRLPSTNSLYKNNGDATFTDVTIDAGLEAYIFSMSNTWADLNRDGNMDVYVSNNPNGNLMYFGEENHSFTESAEVQGCAVFDMSWNALAMDFDNDMDEDLMVCNTPFWGQPGQNNFLSNNGDGLFETNFNTGINISGWNHCAASADFNHDGALDVVILGSDPNFSRIFFGTPNENNWLQVAVNSETGNSGGIGSYLEFWTNGIKQTRYTHCGEGFLAQHSQYEWVGLGSNTVVDSLTVHWLGGAVDTFYDIDANQTLTYTEGDSQLLTYEMTPDANNTYCYGSEAVVLTSDPNFVQWEDGSTDDSFVTNETGYVVATFADANGNLVNDSILVEFHPSIETGLTLQNPLCSGGSDGCITVVLPPESDEWTCCWSNGECETTLCDLDNGVYTYTITDQFGCKELSEVTLNDPEPISIEAMVAEPTCFGGDDGSIAVNAEGGTGAHIISFEEGITPDALTTGEYLVMVTDENGCSSSQTVFVSQPGELTATATTTQPEAEGEFGFVVIQPDGGVAPYNNSWDNGFEDTWENYSLPLGVYVVTITDSSGCILYVTFEIDDAFSVSEQSSGDWDMYPNPTHGEINFTGITNGTLHCFDMSGKLVLRESIVDGTSDLSSLSKGAYQLVIYSGDYALQKRIVIE